MDEATAAIDREMDNLVQSTLREVFTECTILTVAHKLHTVLDCDKIMLLENGQVSVTTPGVGSSDGVLVYLAPSKRPHPYLYALSSPNVS